MSVYFVESSNGLRMSGTHYGRPVCKRGGNIQTWSSALEAMEIIHNWPGYTVRVCPSPLTVHPGTRTLTDESAKRARAFFTAAHPDLPIKLSNDAAVAMLATVFPVLIDGTLHYSGSFQFPEAINHPANQGVLFDA